MSWFDQLLPASFRGVPFQVDALEHSAGDNVVLREYPFQDLPTVFRMGEAAEEIKFSAYVIGDDYTEQRDRLRQMLSGDGVLIHPTAGTMRVFCAGKFSIKEAITSEGGLARFDLTFIRADTRRYPTAGASTQAESDERADIAKAAAKAAFAAQWSTTKVPGWAADRAVARIKNSVSGVWSQISRVSQGLGDFTNTVLGNYRALASGLDELVRTPRLLADQVATLFELPSELSAAAARDFRSAFQWGFDFKKRLQVVDFETSVMPPVGAGLVMYGTGVMPIPTSPARQQADRLVDAGDQLFETMATAAYVQATARLDLDNYDEALRTRTLIDEQCRRLLVAGSRTPAAELRPAMSWHDAVAAMHGAALRDLQARSRDLVRLTSYTPAGWEPTWVISYRLFGTAAFADEIAAMNPHIRNPLLVPPGRPLRIVRHDT